jgi:hypothetical protein
MVVGPAPKCHFVLGLGSPDVVTVALGSQPRQGLTKVWAKGEARESNFMLSKVQKSVKEWTPTLPSEFPFWELESQWTF